VSVGPAKEVQAGQPRSEADAAFLARFDSVMRIPIILSALLPLIIAPQSSGWIGIVVGIASWLVFLADYVAHARHLVHYRRTRLGLFDLGVVILTAPWFLLPGLQAGRFIVVVRLARLARVVMASRRSRRLFNTLGRVGLIALLIVVVGAAVAYHAEHPVNHQFATYGDSLWWAIVTLTTVGYGDIVPVTPTGRWVAVAIMITGIAVLGLLSGSLASFFRGDTKDANGTEPGTGTPDAADPAEGPQPDGSALQALVHEVSALRAQVEALSERLPVQAGGSDPAGGSEGGR
jgi:voltage-gated potassium channel